MQAARTAACTAGCTAAACWPHRPAAPARCRRAAQARTRHQSPGPPPHAARPRERCAAHPCHSSRRRSMREAVGRAVAPQHGGARGCCSPPTHHWAACGAIRSTANLRASCAMPSCSSLRPSGSGALDSRRSAAAPRPAGEAAAAWRPHARASWLSMLLRGRLVQGTRLQVSAGFAVEPAQKTRQHDSNRLIQARMSS